MTKYTRGQYVDSSALDAVMYNDRTQALGVVTMGGSAYEYRGVPASVYERMVGGGSAGRIYAKEVKPQFGPGTYLGYSAHPLGEFVSEDATSDNSGIVSMNQARAALGMPKNLTAATNATVTFPIYSEAQEEPVSRRFTVTFEHDGSERSYEFQGNTMDDALRSLNEIGEMLDLNLKVRSVTQYFE